MYPVDENSPADTLETAAEAGIFKCVTSVFVFTSLFLVSSSISQNEALCSSAEQAGERLEGLTCDVTHTLTQDKCTFHHSFLFPRCKCIFLETTNPCA